LAHIVAIAGSLRQRSFNHALLRAMQPFVPDGSKLEIHTLRGIPVYDQDREQSDYPEAAARLKDAIAHGDGLLLASPEYNHALPGPLKNAIDWLSRPPGDRARVFAGRPVGLVGVTPGRGGTRFAQAAWAPVFQALRLLPWYDQQLYLDDARKLFDEDLSLVEPRVRDLVRGYVEGLFAFCDRYSRTTR